MIYLPGWPEEASVQERSGVPEALLSQLLPACRAVRQREFETILTINKTTERKLNMKDKRVTFMVQAAAIAAVYVVLTMVFAPWSFREVQVRISEALTILPYFTPAAVPGLFVGCLIANILGGAILPDIIFGSLATLIGAVFSYMLRKNKFLVPVPPILANTLIVPFVLRYGYGVNLPILVMMGSVGLGEVISCGVLGMIFLFALEKYAGTLFSSENA